MTDKTAAILIEGVSKKFRTPGKINFPSPKSMRFSIEKPTTKLALDQVSLRVDRGEIFGFLGPNGAGKTTLIKTLVGLLTPDSGTTRLFSKDGMGLESDTRDAKLQFGYLPERPYYHDFLTAEEFLYYHGRLLGLEDKDIAEKIPDVLKQIGLSSARFQKLQTFSKGMLQRIGFAQALLNDPEILILDEPMSGLDPVGRREMRDIILACASLGKTIFFSTHIIHDVEVICSSVGYIREGRLQGAGSIDTLLGKTVKSMEIRFAFPNAKDPSTVAALKSSRKTMDGWVIEVESEANRLEYDVQEVLQRVLSENGVIRSVVPRRSTLEDLFFSESKAQ